MRLLTLPDPATAKEYRPALAFVLSRLLKTMAMEGPGQSASSSRAGTTEPSGASRRGLENDQGPHLPQKKAKNPQEQLLSDLGKATRIFPQWERASRRLALSAWRWIPRRRIHSSGSLRLCSSRTDSASFCPTGGRSHRPVGSKAEAERPRAHQYCLAQGLFGLNSLVDYDWELLGEGAMTEADFQSSPA